MGRYNHLSHPTALRRRVIRILGSQKQFGDGLTRRDWLTVGALAPLGLTLAGYSAAMADGTPVLAAAFAFFCRREIETDAELARGLTFDSLKWLSAQQAAGFEWLGHRTDGILGQIDLVFVALEESFAALGDTADAGFAGVGEKRDDIKRRPAAELPTNEPPADPKAGDVYTLRIVRPEPDASRAS